MGKSANHHYVPKAVLRHFCFEGESLYYYSKRAPKKGIQLRNIDSIFRKRHLNSFKDEAGINHDYLEKFFASNFDNVVNQLVEHFLVCDSESRVCFSEKQRTQFIQFFYNHMRRTPDFHGPIVEEVARKIFLAEGIEELRAKYGPFSEADEKMLLDQSFRKRVIDKSRVQNLGKQSTELLDKLAGMAVCIARPMRSNKQFLVGSTPVIRFQNHEGQKLGETGVELWTPLTPNLCVGLVSKEIGSQILSLRTTEIRKFNLEAYRISTGIASRNSLLISSIVNF